ncbi:UNVERIFIED_CONTAM: hypothetical protein FKN15_052285 [Acipenser sinensis]
MLKCISKGRSAEEPIPNTVTGNAIEEHTSTPGSASNTDTDARDHTARAIGSVADVGLNAEVDEGQPSLRLEFHYRGPFKVSPNFAFSKGKDGRRFTANLRYHTLVNGERIQRSWLMYSQKTNN